MVSLIHHLCKRETKRNVEAIVWFLVECVFLYYIHTVLYSIHDMVFTRDGTRKFPKYRKKRSTSSECKVQKWIWSGCTAAMCLKRVQAHTGMIRMGINGEVREEKKTLGLFFGHMS